MLEALYSFLEEKKCFTALTTKGPVICQVAMKKAPKKPSGPGSCLFLEQKPPHESQLHLEFW